MICVQYSESHVARWQFYANPSTLSLAIGDKSIHMFGTSFPSRSSTYVWEGVWHTFRNHRCRLSKYVIIFWYIPFGMKVYMIGSDFTLQMSDISVPNWLFSNVVTCCLKSVTDKWCTAFLASYKYTVSLDMWIPPANLVSTVKYFGIFRTIRRSGLNGKQHLYILGYLINDDIDIKIARVDFCVHLIVSETYLASARKKLACRINLCGKCSPGKPFSWIHTSCGGGAVGRRWRG